MGRRATVSTAANRADVVAIVDEGLGNSSYLVALEDGRALVIDPSRDPTGYRSELARRGLVLAFAAETHLHADFVSGACELGALGATILAPAAGRREFAHRRLADGDEVDLAGMRLRALATPGHTPEHVAYLLLDESRPIALFTGGSLLVGTVARTDLVDPARTEELARAMYRSVHHILSSLPDDLPVYPTHGAGSFCAAPTGNERTTTIGRERATNPLVAAPDEDAFVSLLLGSLGSYPPYFLRLQEVNRRGPQVYGGLPALQRLTTADLQRGVVDGAEIVDTRSAIDFAAGHIPGAVSIPLRPAFGTWLGWVVDADRPIVFVVGDGQDRADLVRQTLNVGYDSIAGELDGGMDAWRAAGGEVRRIDVVAGTPKPQTALVDVRQAAEYEAGHIPGAVLVELGAVRSSALPPGPLTITCSHGERAMTAASLIERGGRSDLTVLLGGAQGWAAVPGNRLAVGR